MITPTVMKQAVWFRGVPHLPCNTCSHCGEPDDPESKWAEDDDGDRICLQCAERKGRQFCAGCEASITEVDVESGVCTQCGKGIEG